MSGITEVEVKEREKYIYMELKKLQGLADRQESLRSDLVTRLKPVSRSDPGREDKNIAESYGVPLADELAAVTIRFSATNDVLEDILNQLEI